MELSEGPNGRVRVKPTDTKKTYAQVPYLAKSVATRSVTLPRGYLIANPEPAVLAKLRQHGIVVERLSAAATVAVEGFRVTSLEGADAAQPGPLHEHGEGRVLRGHPAVPGGHCRRPHWAAPRRAGRHAARA